jgi:hypothetical protein
MNSTDTCYLINTTPSYFYLLPLHITLLKRYAPTLQWPIYIATEEPTHSSLVSLQETFPDVKIIPLTQEQEGFFESRQAATRALPDTIEYVFPIQEDFLLEARPLENVFEEAFDILHVYPTIRSLRMMPCPGPRGNNLFAGTKWHILDLQAGDMLFTYQATLWRRDAYQEYMDWLCIQTNGLNKEQKKKLAIHTNLAEIHQGQVALRDQGGIHLAYPREGPQPNAVYLAPWPYRPTAVVRGRLEPWAEELADREKIPLRTGPSFR